MAKKFNPLRYVKWASRDSVHWINKMIRKVKSISRFIGLVFYTWQQKIFSKKKKTVKQ